MEKPTEEFGVYDKISILVRNIVFGDKELETNLKTLELDEAKIFFKSFYPFDLAPNYETVIILATYVSSNKVIINISGKGFVKAVQREDLRLINFWIEQLLSNAAVIGKNLDVVVAGFENILRGANTDLIKILMDFFNKNSITPAINTKFWDELSKTDKDKLKQVLDLTIQFGIEVTIPTNMKTYPDLARKVWLAYCTSIMG